MGTEFATRRGEVFLDGVPVPDALLGDDVEIVDGRTWVTVSEERLYNLIRSDGQYGEHTIEIRFEEDGGAVSLYAWTFG